ncbi:GspE/PulE family protein [Desulfogranum japonicum]|uniref:GspE/PulE family protein n=1 Tax=Desulfogranum japonicum TaxID=231447 RepID=UPI0004291314|nr:GspE/PulE family protein [Desulfogranum japonicum]
MGTNSSQNQIVRLLIEQGTITEKQYEHAQRVQKKLSVYQPLLKVLKELKFISDAEIKATIQSSSNSIRIGDLLTELGYISEDDLQAACRIQAESKEKQRLGTILVKQNYIDEQLLIEILSIQMGFPLLDPSLTEIDRELCQKIPSKILRSHCFLPLKKEDKHVLVALADPLDQDAKDVASRFLGAPIKPALSPRITLENLINQICKHPSSRTRYSGIKAGPQSAVGIVNEIILQAVANDASDIHIEPLPDRLQVRFREDGVLAHYKDFPHNLIPQISSRIKIMCQADIAEKRRHQGGRILFEHEEGQLDLRVSIYITVHGEKIVLRLLNRKQQLFDIQSIGLSPKMLSRFLENAVYQPSGVLLVTGPTGSGKTSTIYSCINTLKSPKVSIITAEEPVEYVIDGIAQCSIDPKIDLTFEETLRHIVRQDPDIIVIGEIRDTYSAEVAVQAALTGHKVLSTFHTEDSIGGLIRLLNMNIAPFLVSSTVVSVLAQRLLRRVCPFCATDTKPTPVQLQRLRCTPADLEGAHFKKGRGCSKCKQTGYKGRIGVFELLVLDELVRNAILEQKTSYDIRNISIKHSGLITLLEDGLLKAAQGTTTIDEVLRCLPNLSNPRSLGEIRRLSGL